MKLYPDAYKLDVLYFAYLKTTSRSELNDWRVEGFSSEKRSDWLNRFAFKPIPFLSMEFDYIGPVYNQPHNPEQQLINKAFSRNEWNENYANALGQLTEELTSSESVSSITDSPLEALDLIAALSILFSSTEYGYCNRGLARRCGESLFERDKEGPYGLFGLAIMVTSVDERREWSDFAKQLLGDMEEYRAKHEEWWLANGNAVNIALCCDADLVERLKLVDPFWSEKQFAKKCADSIQAYDWSDCEGDVDEGYDPYSDYIGDIGLYAKASAYLIQDSLSESEVPDYLKALNSLGHVKNAQQMLDADKELREIAMGRNIVAFPDAVAHAIEGLGAKVEESRRSEKADFASLRKQADRLIRFSEEHGQALDDVRVSQKREERIAAQIAVSQDRTERMTHTVLFKIGNIEDTFECLRQEAEKITSEALKKCLEADFENAKVEARASFGPSWDKLNENQQSFVITAIYLYRTMPDDDEYAANGVMIVAMEAYESALASVFKYQWYDFLDRNKANLYCWPKGFKYWDKDAGRYCRRERKDADFTLGGLPYVLGYDRDEDEYREMKDNSHGRKWQMGAFLRNVFPGKNAWQVFTERNGLAARTFDAADRWRNPAGHTYEGSLPRSRARECIIEVLGIDSEIPENSLLRMYLSLLPKGYCPPE